MKKRIMSFIMSSVFAASLISVSYVCAEEYAECGTITFTVIDEETGELFKGESFENLFFLNQNKAIASDAWKEWGKDTQVDKWDINESNPHTIENVPIEYHYYIGHSIFSFNDFYYEVDKEKSEGAFDFLSAEPKEVKVYMKKFYYPNSDTQPSDNDNTSYEQKEFKSGTKHLSVSEVISFANKGNDLTWSDFEPYAGDWHGIGMYTHVCEYDLDAGYYLLVEGNPPEKPNIVKLYRKDVDKSIDIRTGDINAYLGETLKYVTTVPSGGQDNERQMTTNDVIWLSQKGRELEWIDFEKYKRETMPVDAWVIGWHFDLGNDYSLEVLGNPPDKPETVRLYRYDFDNGIDIRTSDVIDFIAKNSTAKIPNTDYTFSQIYSMNEKEIEAMFDENGLEHSLVWVKNQFGNWQDEVNISILSNPFAKDKDNTSELFWDRDTLMETLALPTDLFEIEQVMRGYNNGKPVILCRIIVKPYDNYKSAELRANALNFVQLNPYFSDFVNNTIGGSISVQPINLKGDANCDGQVDLSDAVMIMQALANPNKYGIDGTAEHHLTEQGKLNADMDGDGLTVGDAQAIQKKLLGLDKADSQSIDSSLIANKLFRYEKSADPGIYDDLCDISFGSNGTYFYHIGYYKSSNQDQGTWTISGDTVVLTGQYGTNKFRYEDKALVYIAEGSDGFSDLNPSCTPKDGEKFILVPERINNT